MDYIVPPINLTGTFKLKEPLASLINEKVLYTVDGIKSITSLIDDEIDVEKFIYKEQGLSSEEYKEHLMSKVPIVTLKSEGNSLFNIPAIYFTYIPQITGKMFKNKAMIVNLGYIPNDIDLDFVTTEIYDLVLNLSGIKSDISIEDVSGNFIISYEEFDTFEAERRSNLKSNTTCRFLLKNAMTDIATYKLKLGELVKSLK